jgi:hypothetical protein
VTNDEEKKDRERRTFVKFCEVARLNIVEGSFAQPDPPAPDIEVEIAELGHVAFELVDLNNKIERQAAALLSASASGLSEYHANLPAPELTAFNGLYVNASISVFFRRELGNSDRKRTYRRLFKALIELPQGFTGSVLEFPYCLDPSRIREIFTEHRLRVDSLPEIEDIHIARGVNIQGPRFASPSAGKSLQLDLGKLEEKLRKTPYCTDRPQELLATVHGPGEISYAADAANIPIIIGKLLPHSCFRRVWIFEQIMAKATLYKRDD